ncbi:MAG: sterol desaturase family protein [Paracoccaceae bacterium]|nr:sterol desaturase family protein [Paracoccaceae bacterium]
MDTLVAIFDAVLDQLIHVVTYPFLPGQRIFWLYLVTSIMVAWFVYRAVRARGQHATERDRDAAQGTFLRFLFPSAVWSHPSAWLDVRYFFFHRVAKHFLLLGVGGGSLAAGYWLTSGGQLLDLVEAKLVWTDWRDWVVALSFMAAIMIVADFIGWFAHFLQHKVPLLWQFHKVHHSAEVMHPLSNYREHPVDNLLYAVFIGFGYGASYGIAVRFFGYLPSAPTILGVPLILFLFNIAGYNLRHSHVWLRWPGVWSKVFPSPAHHHVHHSCHPDHIDKNFAFIFPVWDVIFGTYIMPEDNRDVKFGVPEEQGRDLDSVLRLYWVPFRDAYRLFAPKRKESEAEAEATTDDEPRQVPAE